MNALENPADIAFCPFQIHKRARFSSRTMVVVAHQDDLVKMRASEIQLVNPRPFAREINRWEDSHGELLAV